MTILIRPHHFLCMLTFLGKGYTASFVSNYTRIIERLNSGEDIKIVHGPDDICRPMLTEADHHCRNDSVRMRDDIASSHIHGLLGFELKPGLRLDLNRAQIDTLRHAYSDGAFRVACDGCRWQDMCTSIAARDYWGCRLEPVRKPNSG